jgi:hypothetical protein
VPTASEGRRLLEHLVGPTHESGLTAHLGSVNGAYVGLAKRVLYPASRTVPASHASLSNLVKYEVTELVPEHRRRLTGHTWRENRVLKHPRSGALPIFLLKQFAMIPRLSRDTSTEVYVRTIHKPPHSIECCARRARVHVLLSHTDVVAIHALPTHQLVRETASRTRN